MPVKCLPFLSTSHAIQRIKSTTGNTKLKKVFYCQIVQVEIGLLFPYINNLSYLYFPDIYDSRSNSLSAAPRPKG